MAKRRKITEREYDMIEVACKYFTENPTSEFYRDVADLVLETMEQINCCILWKRDTRFAEICQRHGVDPKKREVRITENWGAVRGTSFWGRNTEEFLYRE